jgi:hypothetical protein
MNIYKQKIFVLITGLLTAGILLEVALRITGSVHMKGRFEDKAYSLGRKECVYTILCLGNSWTLGVGAPTGMSYPDHLRRMLCDMFPNRDINVINAGVDNLNSAEMLDRLKSQINSIMPDLIILRTGQPNISNHYKYSQYLERENKIENPFYKMMFSLNDFLYNKIRVFRLAQLLTYEIINKAKSKWLSEDKAIRVKKALNLARDKSENSYQHIEYYKFQSERGYMEAIEMAMLLSDLMHIFIRDSDILLPVSDAEIEQAIGWIERAAKYRPNIPAHYFPLANLYILKKEHKKAAEYLIKGILLEPNFRDEEYSTTNVCYLLLRTLYDATPDPEVKIIIETFIQKLEAYKPDSAEIFLWSKSLSMKNVTDWIASDISEIVRIIKANNIDLIMQNYPPALSKRSQRALASVNDIIRRKAFELKVPFIDNERLFIYIYARGQSQ